MHTWGTTVPIGVEVFPFGQILKTRWLDTMNIYIYIYIYNITIFIYVALGGKRKPELKR